MRSLIKNMLRSETSMSGRAWPAPLAALQVLLQQRHLIAQLARKEIHAKYRKSSFGLLWLLLTPICLVGAYTLVFGVLLQVRWGGAGSTLEFALVLHAGIMFYMFFSEVLARSTVLISSNKTYVTKMVFPLEVLSWVTVLVAALNFLVMLLVWVAFFVAIKGYFPIGVLWVPLIFIPFALFCLGLSWLFSALAAYHADVEHGMPMVLLLLMYMSPLLFPAEKMPETFKLVLLANPLTYVLEAARAALLHAQPPTLALTVAGTAVSLAIAWLGLTSFRGNQRGFADVL